MFQSRASRVHYPAGFAVLLLMFFVSACSRPPAETSGVRRMPAGQQYAGFLSDYSKLKPSPVFENTVSYLKMDPQKNIHKYVAIIVEPVAVYLSSNADPKDVPNKGRAALAEYYQSAITAAVSDAFPVVKDPGPLVLRLRSAIIGVDVGPQGDKSGESALDHVVNIGKVGVEMELVDSETGEQIAAAVDRETLGEGASVGSATFSREEKFRAATEAFDGWAGRLRAFLDLSMELPPEDVARALASYRPYGGAPPAGK